MKSYYFRSKEILATTIYKELKFFIKISITSLCHKHKIYTPDKIHQNPELANIKMVLDNSNEKTIGSELQFLL